MAIRKKTEREQALAALERRRPKELAAFILSLAEAPSGIGTRVQVFAAADDPRVAASILRGEIDFLREGERDYDVRHRRGSEWIRRIDLILDAIEDDLLPKNRDATIELLTHLVAQEETICEHCDGDDFDAAEAFERARELFNVASAAKP
jgi:hypothetical protein